VSGKVMTAAEAVADIPDGASIALAGFGVSHRYPSTLITALRDAGPRGLTVYCNGLGQPGVPPSTPRPATGPPSPRARTSATSMASRTCWSAGSPAITR
jgi:hypothetical protein